MWIRWEAIKKWEQLFRFAGFCGGAMLRAPSLRAFQRSADGAFDAGAEEVDGVSSAALLCVAGQADAVALGGVAQSDFLERLLGVPEDGGAALGFAVLDGAVGVFDFAGDFLAAGGAAGGAEDKAEEYSQEE